MKPLKLVIQGIRSFTDKVEIDFEGVSKNGLFGIFGSTGSGKSTILESVIIALYGEISGQKMAEIINLRCKSAYVNLSFELLHGGVRRRYLVERAFKLKRDGAYGGAVASLYETTGGVNVVLASQTNEVNRQIEDILGLGLNEFTKCIILPQGEFSQFVRAAKADRIKIIEKLFSLERFGDGLNLRVKSILSELNMQIALKTEDLKHYEDATDDALKKAQADLAFLQNESNSFNVKLLKIKEYIENNQYYYNLDKQLKADSDKLAALTERSGEIEEKTVKARLYERACSIKRESAGLEALASEMERLEKDLTEKQTLFKRSEVECQKCFEEYRRIGELSKEREELTVKRDALLESRGDFNLYGELKRKIAYGRAMLEGLNEKLQSNLKKLNELSILEDKTQGKLTEIEERIKLSQVFSSISRASLKEEYSEQIAYYKSYNDKLQSFNIRDALYNFAYEESCARLEAYNGKLLNLQNAGEEKPEDAIESYKQAMQLKRLIEDELNALRIEMARLEESVKNIHRDIDLQTKEVENNENNLNSLNVKLLKITDNIDGFEESLTAVTAMCKKVATDIERINESYQNARQNLDKATVEVKAAAVERDSATKAFDNLSQVVVAMLSEEISTLDVANEILSSVENLEALTNEIEQFDKDFEFYSKSVERMRREIDSSGFSSVEYLKKIEERGEIEEVLENLKENLINCKNFTEKLSQNLNKRCIIEKDIKNLRARASVFERLEQAISRRAFAEFVSAEFLSDVARSARRTLLELTGGKYDVVYKDSIEAGKDGFYILDNMNGGAERTIASLSGGETFLVSLSLALALSASIYAGSSRPMEFFFLDEGFGTLDEDLVDTVLSSLEKLRNKNFSIGLISHLAEMKSRIDCKITVLPATETQGSRVIHSGIV